MRNVRFNAKLIKIRVDSNWLMAIGFKIFRIKFEDILLSISQDLDLIEFFSDCLQSFIIENLLWLFFTTRNAKAFHKVHKALCWWQF